MSRRRDDDMHLEELSPDARRIIDAAIDAEGPTDRDRERVRGAVLAAIAGGGATLGASAAEAATGSATSGASATGAGIEAVGSAAPEFGAKAWATATAESASRAGGLSTFAKVTIVAALIGGAAGLYLAVASQSDPAPETTPAPTAPAPIEDVEDTTRDTPPPPEPEPVLDEADITDTPPPPPKRVVRKTPTPAPSPTPAAATKTIESLDQERALLDLANKAIRSGKPARALALIEESQQLFPDARLKPERRATRVLALCALGRTDESKRAAAAKSLKEFRAVHGGSPLLGRLESACASR